MKIVRAREEAGGASSARQIRVIAEELALRQTYARLPGPLRTRLGASLQEHGRPVTRLRAMLEVARRTPPGA